MGFYLKHPAASIDYSVDWAAGYLDGRTIASSIWTVAPDEAEGVRVAAEMTAPTRTAATIEGGVVGRVYRVSNRVMLSDGRADERTLTLRVERR